MGSLIPFKQQIARVLVTAHIKWGVKSKKTACVGYEGDRNNSKPSKDPYWTNPFQWNKLKGFLLWLKRGGNDQFHATSDKKVQVISMCFKFWDTPPQNKHGTWKWTLGKGDSYWKPQFPGSMLIFGGVIKCKHGFTTRMICMVDCGYSMVFLILSSLPHMWWKDLKGIISKSTSLCCSKFVHRTWNCVKLQFLFMRAGIFEGLGPS